MKRYISILGLSIAVILFVVTGCNEAVDPVTENAKEGAITTTEGTSGKMLGSPDVTSGVVDFLDVDMTFTVDIEEAGTGVSSLSIYKQVVGKSEKILIENTSAYPYTLNYTTIGGILDGTGVASTALRIGDAVNVWAEIEMSDGRTLFYNTSILTMTVQCLSDLAGTYDMTGEDDTGFTFGYDIIIEEVNPGEYSFRPTSGYITAVYGYSGDYALATQMFDVCNVITIPKQNLGSGQSSYGEFSNQVEGSGTVNADGSIDLEYSTEGFGTDFCHLVPK